MFGKVGKCLIDLIMCWMFLLFIRVWNLYVCLMMVFIEFVLEGLFRNWCVIEMVCVIVLCLV